MLAAPLRNPFRETGENRKGAEDAKEMQERKGNNSFLFSSVLLCVLCALCALCGSLRFPCLELHALESLEVEDLAGFVRRRGFDAQFADDARHLRHLLAVAPRQ